MEDADKQKLVEDFLHRRVNPLALSRDDFIELLDGLKRMYSARVWNCVDATAKNDPEWGALSDVFQRALKELGVEGN